MSEARRVTLGGVSQSALNARPSLSRTSITGDVGPKRGGGRVSLAVDAPSRISMDTTRQKTSISRQSSIAPAPRADPRNVQEKEVVHNNIRLLLKYLMDHNYDQPFSGKILSRPSGREYQNIQIFLFRQIDRNFVCTGKFEDEVIAFYSFLNYPFCKPLKSNIASAGTPHAWPVLLAALVWIVQLLSYDENSSTDDLDSSVCFEDPVLLHKAFHSHLGQGYRLFLAGDDDTYARLEEKFFENFQNQYASMEGQHQRVESEHSQLVDDIQGLEERKKMIPHLEAQKKDFTTDVAKFKKIVEEQQQHREQLEIRCRAKKEELDKLVASIDVTQDEISLLREKISKQELSPTDVERMVREREALQQAQEEASAHRQDLKRQLWTLETELKDAIFSLKDAADSYTAVATALKIVPASARNARGLDLAITVDALAKRKEKLISSASDPRAVIMPTLQSYKSEISQEIASYRSQRLTDLDTCEELDLKLAELQEERSRAESKTKRADDTYRHEKDAYEKASGLVSLEISTVEERLLRVRDTATDEARAAAAQRKLQEATMAKEHSRKEHATRTRELTARIMEVVTECASHRELVKGQLAVLQRAYERRLEELSLGRSMGAFVTARTVLPSQQRNELDDFTAAEASLGHTMQESFSEHLMPPVPGGGSYGHHPHSHAYAMPQQTKPQAYLHSHHRGSSMAALPPAPGPPYQPQAQNSGRDKNGLVYSAGQVPMSEAGRDTEESGSRPFRRQDMDLTGTGFEESLARLGRNHGSAAQTAVPAVGLHSWREGSNRGMGPDSDTYSQVSGTGTDIRVAGILGMLDGDISPIGGSQYGDDDQDGEHRGRGTAHWDWARDANADERRPPAIEEGGRRRLATQASEETDMDLSRIAPDINPARTAPSALFHAGYGYGSHGYEYGNLDSSAMGEPASILDI